MTPGLCTRPSSGRPRTCPRRRPAPRHRDDVVAVRGAIEEFDGLFRGVGTRGTSRIRVDSLRADPLQLLAAQGYDFIFAHNKKKAGRPPPRLIVVPVPFASLVNLDD